jgi:hypothetical protein
MLAAISRQPVDRIPTDIWATGEVWKKLRDHFGESTDIHAELHIDGFAGWFDPEYVGPTLPQVAAGESVSSGAYGAGNLCMTAVSITRYVFLPLPALRLLMI